MTPAYWLLQTTADLPSDDGWLAPEETAVLSGFQVSKRRNEWTLGRWTAKLTLALYLGPQAPLHDLSILAAEDGAPEAFLNGRPVPVALSLSHRYGHALAVVTPAPAALGCDLERIEPRSDAFARDYFTESEQALVTAVPASDRPLRANLIWAAKECALKGLRQGLRLDTRRVVVDLPPADATDGWQPFSVHAVLDDRCFSGWWRAVDSFVVTIAADPAPSLPIALEL